MRLLYSSTLGIEPLINAEIIHSGDSRRERNLHTNLAVNEHQEVGGGVGGVEVRVTIKM